VREALKTKKAEWIFVILFLAILFGVASLPLGRDLGLIGAVTISIIGVISYVFLFRERNRGRWLKIAFGFAVGLALGVIAVVLSRAL
jgi:hypothetical protein